VLIDQLREDRLLKEAEFWHLNYDKVLRRANDLGLPTLRKYVGEGEERQMSRREKTDPLQWGRLSLSAEDSDNSVQQTHFTHPLLIAKQKAQAQKFIPFKKKVKQRKPDELVNIDGKTLKWGAFNKAFYEDIERRHQRG
jgi:hypothetical protein